MFCNGTYSIVYTAVPWFSSNHYFEKRNQIVIQIRAKREFFSNVGIIF